MSNLAEIQDAVIKLGHDEKRAFSLWFDSQLEPELTPQDEQQLLRSLDKAIRNLEAGRGVPVEDVRKRVAAWAAR